MNVTRERLASELAYRIEALLGPPERLGERRRHQYDVARVSRELYAHPMEKLERVRAWLDAGAAWNRVPRTLWGALPLASFQVLSDATLVERPGEPRPLTLSPYSAGYCAEPVTAYLLPRWWRLRGECSAEQGRRLSGLLMSGNAEQVRQAAELAAAGDLAELLPGRMCVYQLHTFLSPDFRSTTAITVLRNEQHLCWSDEEAGWTAKG